MKPFNLPVVFYCGHRYFINSFYSFTGEFVVYLKPLNPFLPIEFNPNLSFVHL